DGRLGPPEAGEVVMSVLSPEALARDQQEVRDVILRAPDDAEPLVIIVEAAEELREDELAAVLDAAARAGRSVILRVLAGASPPPPAARARPATPAKPPATASGASLNRPRCRRAANWKRLRVA